MRPVGEFSTQVMRRRVDLVRVGSALCRAASSHWLFRPVTRPQRRPTVFLRQRREPRPHDDRGMAAGRWGRTQWL